MTKRTRPLAKMLLFPDRRGGLLQPERRSIRLARSHDQLVRTLERLSDSYRALLVGERITDAEEMLAQVSNALTTAARAGDVETA